MERLLAFDAFILLALRLHLLSLVHETHVLDYLTAIVVVIDGELLALPPTLLRVSIDLLDLVILRHLYHRCHLARLLGR